MTRGVVHPGEAVPTGTPYAEWLNTTGEWLVLRPPGLVLLNLCPEGRIQIPRADLAKVPELEPWLEGCELRGVLRMSDTC